MSYERLDRQLKAFSDRLIKAVGISEQETTKVATSIAAEVRFLEPGSRAEVHAAGPVPLGDRLDELQTFQAWMDLASTVRGNAAVTRAQVIIQNYVCFVYLNEASFRALRKVSKPGSVTQRCCTYLTDNPVRAFRNAIAHSNWTYAPSLRRAHARYIDWIFGSGDNGAFGYSRDWIASARMLDMERASSKPLQQTGARCWLRPVNGSARQSNGRPALGRAYENKAAPRRICRGWG
jgi:hypothetical protein